MRCGAKCRATCRASSVTHGLHIYSTHPRWAPRDTREPHVEHLVSHMGFTSILPTQGEHQGTPKVSTIYMSHICEGTPKVSTIYVNHICDKGHRWPSEGHKGTPKVSTIYVNHICDKGHRWPSEGHKGTPKVSTIYVSHTASVYDLRQRPCSNVWPSEGHRGLQIAFVLDSHMYSSLPKMIGLFCKRAL